MKNKIIISNIVIVTLFSLFLGCSGAKDKMADARSAAEKELAMRRALEAKRNALLADKVYPMPVNVSENYFSNSSLVELKAVEKKKSLTDKAKDQLVRSIMAINSGYIEPRTYEVNGFEITGPSLKGNMTLENSDSPPYLPTPKRRYWDETSTTEMFARMMIATPEIYARMLAGTAMMTGAVVEGAAKAATGDFESPDSLSALKLMENNMDKLEEIFSFGSRWQEYSYNIKSSGGIDSECKCKEEDFNDSKKGSVLDCEFIINNVEYTLNLAARAPYDRYPGPFFTGELSLNSGGEEKTYPIKQTIDTNWDGESYYTPNRTFIIGDENNEMLVITSGKEVLPPKSTPTLKPSFGMMKAIAEQSVKAAKTGGQTDWTEQVTVYKAMYLNNKLEEKDAAAFNLISVVLSDYDRALCDQPCWGSAEYNPEAKNIMVPKPGRDGDRVNPAYTYWQWHLTAMEKESIK